ncbi:uncharacterized protein [Henckelia pumila]|uniref:uncharacterized protein n=1 Tax=Henckelia pumila TaxID=405737 RepID=UPI003C6E04E6
MGENEGWSEPGGPLPNGLLPGAGPIMMALDSERWMKAEERTTELIACIQPNQLSEERRNAVADYVQRLIMKCFPCQVCTFGSVPLKTYLPDGDIDLTAFSHDQVLKDTWANQVRDMLENEEKNENAEFHVKEVQYIQAEVKIIKCLVENIVVDISFNQVGGLCTLCFLDEVDNLINQNHLFKRSIILIKAWCYYESRILGAHHGLISTYALETLVLYIFHVFNNSFHGPLEVLYRFLEFFSNFDWDSFCVSLWGPVPISSLPDVTAESPRKDSGELLLSKLFLDACSSVYAVFPGGQENNGQPFVSKHFNVVDPLRVNNNLGRSVSKGNSFRIRSAFAFGAKRLARLLECPTENLVYEVNQFFMNTWERHGSGHRPDAPGADSWRLKLSNPDGFCNFDKSKNILSGKRINEKSFLETEMQGNVRGVSHENLKSSSSMIPTSEISAISHTHSLKTQFNLNSIQGTDRIGRDPAFDQAAVNIKAQKDLKANHFINDNQGRFLFARTRSSPELTDAYGDVSSQVQRSLQAETANSHAPSVRLDNSNMRKNIGSESVARPKSHSSNDDSLSVRHVAAQPTLDTTADSNSNSNSHNQEFGLDSLSEDFSSTPTAQVMHQEEQDIVNMMASASLQGFNGQVHLPLNLTSPHAPFQVPPSFLASMGYTQRNMPGFAPTNFPFMDPSFANMQFAHGFISPQMTPYFPGVDLSLPSEDSVEQSNENFGLVEMNSREANNDAWHEQDIGSSSNYEPEGKNFDSIPSDDKPPEVSSGLKYIPPFRVSGATRVQDKHARGKRGSVLENSDSSVNQDIRSSEFFAEERSASSRFSSATHSNSLRSRTSSESSWDGSSVKTPKSTKDKRGKKVFSTDQSASHGKGKNMSEHISNQAEDYDREWGTLLNLENEIVERNPGSEQDTLQIPRHHLPGLEVAQTSGSDSIMPFAPMLIGNGSRQGMNDNSGLITFYPTGPPIPFLTMLPLYNIPPETGSSDPSSGHFGGDETLDQSESGINCISEELDHSEDFNSCSSLRGANTSDEQKSDILNSDFASHWQNLQVGRYCQNPRYHAPLVYPSPMMVPPVYLQGQFPYDNTGRTHSTNTNIFSQLMTSYGQRLVPIAPLHSVSSRPPHVYQHYVDDMPRHRSGTGTYLPNPKLSVRERHSSGTRRGNYNHDRNDTYGDREGNWNANSKSRAATRSHNRNQADKSNTRTGRLGPSENRAERSWNAYRHESIPSYQSQNGPSHSNPSQNGPQSVAYSVHHMSATNPNGVSNGPSVPPMVMLYPFDHNASYSSHVEPLEFGSLGPVAFPGDQSQINDGSRTRTDNRLKGGPEHRSSPDQPSSPHHHRKM